MKVTIEFEGTPEEVGQWLVRLGASEEGGLSSGPVEVPDEALTWSPQVADRLVRRITEDARRALRYLAEHTPEVFFEDLQEHLGMNGIQSGGVMASFGFAENAGLPRPYRVDRARRRYVIDPEIAPILLDALDRHEERHGRAA